MDTITYKDAMSSPDSGIWKEAMNLEVDRLRSRMVVRPVRTPQNAAIYKSEWVYQIDKKDDTFQAKVKIIDDNCPETKAEKSLPPPENTSIDEILLAMAAGANNDWKFHRVLIESPYSHVDLAKPVYMRPPQGVSIKPGQVWRVEKVIYGMKKAPKLWFNALKSALESQGFERVANCRGLFYRRAYGRAMVLTYAYDILIITRSDTTANQIESKLNNQFEVRYRGPTNEFLNLSFEFGSETIAVRDQLNVTQLLEEFEDQIWEDRFPVTVAAYYKDLLRATRIARYIGKSNTDDIDDTKFYPFWLKQLAEPLDEERAARFRRGVGCISALGVRGRPDLAFAGSQLSRHIHNPRIVHWKMLCRCLCYLKSTEDYAPIQLYRSTEMNILARNCSEPAGRLENPQFGHLWEVGRSLVSWTTKRYKGANLSADELQQFAESKCAERGNWIRDTLAAMGFVRQNAETEIYQSYHEDLDVSYACPILCASTE